MIVKLRHPDRELTFDQSMRVGDLLNRLGLNRESHLVISDGRLVPRDTMLGVDAVIEIRPVISGGNR